MRVYKLSMSDLRCLIREEVEQSTINDILDKFDFAYYHKGATLQVQNHLGDAKRSIKAGLYRKAIKKLQLAHYTVNNVKHPDLYHYTYDLLQKTSKVTGEPVPSW